MYVIAASRTPTPTILKPTTGLLCVPRVGGNPATLIKSCKPDVSNFKPAGPAPYRCVIGVCARQHKVAEGACVLPTREDTDTDGVVLQTPLLRGSVHTISVLALTKKKVGGGGASLASG